MNPALFFQGRLVDENGRALPYAAIKLTMIRPLTGGAADAAFKKQMNLLLSLGQHRVAKLVTDDLGRFRLPMLAWNLFLDLDVTLANGKSHRVGARFLKPAEDRSAQHEDREVVVRLRIGK